jgi:putative methionine-R-sulfoxide reductase with GAF domain
MRRGISAIAGACSAAGQPSVMRAVGTDVAPDGSRVTLFLSRRQSRQLLQDVAETGRLAVVFSEPFSHRTAQLKGVHPQVRPATEADRPVLARYLASMEHELGRIQLPVALARAMLAWRLEDLVAVTLVPTQGFDQTPGPKAGAALPARAPDSAAPSARMQEAAGADGAVPAAPVPDGDKRDAVAGSGMGPGAADPGAAETAAADPHASPAAGPAVHLGELRACFEGVIPAIMATADLDGVPNVAYISQVCYVDERHVALSFQFFNKTRQNILVRPDASVLVLDPDTAAFYRLHIRYLRTESEGPLFESMKARLAGIASHSGMAGVFRLLGSDVYEVRAVERVPGEPLPPPPARCGLLGAVRRASERLAQAASLDEALGAVLSTLTEVLDIQHAMVLMLDAATQRLYTVASVGYPTSGVGSEIDLGDGVIGVAARERTPVRIMHMSSAYRYSRAQRESLDADAHGLAQQTDIPWPGLPEPHSQLAVPIMCSGRLLGVLFAESPQELRLSFEDEDVFVAMAGHLGAAIELLQSASEAPEPAAATAPATAAAGAPVQVRHYAANDSVFINGSYLIKGVAGAILWALLREHASQGRTEFSNRELRLNPEIRLPDLSDNLEARLVLLQRRLTEYSPHIRIEKTGRGRFRLVVTRPLDLQDVAAA